MIKLLIAAAMLAVLCTSGHTASSDYLTQKGLTMFMYYDINCKPGSLSDDSLFVMSKLWGNWPQAEKDAVTAEIKQEAAKLGRSAYCTLLDIKIGGAIGEYNAAARDVLRAVR